MITVNARGGDYRLVLFAIVFLYLVLGIFYSITTPLFEAPDEVWHYAFVRQVASHYELPVARPGVSLPWAQEATQPPLYYVAAAPVIGWMDARDLDKTPASNPFAQIGRPEAATNDNRNAFLHTVDEDFPFHGTALAVHLLRWFSVALGAATILLAAALAREIFPDRPAIPLGTAAFIAFLPQFLFINSTVSNDNITTLFVTASLWYLARLMRTGLTPGRVVLVGVIAGYAALTKLSGLGPAALSLLAILWIASRKHNWRIGLYSLALFASIVALVAGWWYVRNWLLYNDVFAVAPMAELMGARAVPLSLWRWLSAESEGLRLSAWGLFGWFNILASPAFYYFFDGLALLGGLGVVVALARRQRVPGGVLVLALWCLYSVLALWRFSSVTIATQGRLLFPALPAYAILWSWGMAALFPARLPSWIRGAIPIAQFVVASAVPVLFIAPAYVPTVLASDLPANITRLDWSFEDGSQWLGVSVDRGDVEPGDSATVTLYQRLRSPASDRTAIYFHVVGSAETIIAQRDSLPGSGNLAALESRGNSAGPVRVNTSSLPVIADSFRIALPITAAAPDVWRIEAGLYDVATGKRLTKTVGGPQGDGSTLAVLRAHRADRPWGFDFDGRATLDGAEFDRAVTARGGLVRLNLRWSQAMSPRVALANRGAGSLRVFAHVLGSDDRLWATAEGELNREMQLELRLDPSTPPGVYPVELGLYPAPDGDRLSIFDRRGQLVGDRLLLGPLRVE